MGNVKTSIFLILFASISVACVPAGLRAPGPSNEDGWANKEKATPERIRNEMLKCGEGRYLSNIEPLDGESIDNARARLQECLFAKGFYIKSGSGGIALTLIIVKNCRHVLVRQFVRITATMVNSVP